MKRILKFLGLALLLIVVTVVVVAVFFLNPILERAKPSIEKKIAAVIQAPVTFGPIEVSSFPSPQIKLSDLKIGGESNGFSLGTLTLNCQLLPLLRGAVQVTKIELSSATLAVEKNRKGKLVVGGIDLSKLQDPDKAAKEKQEDSGSSPLDLSIEELALEKIDLTYLDASRTPPLTVTATNLAVAASGISPTGAESFRVTGTLLNSPHQNFALTGSAKLDKTTMLPSGDVTLVLQAFELDAVAPLVEAFLPELKDKLALKGPLDGSIRLNLTGLKTGYEIKVRGTKAEISFADTFTKKAGTEFSIDAAGDAAATGLLSLSSSEALIGSSKFGASFAPLSAKSLPNAAHVNVDVADLTQLASILPALAKFSPTGKIVGKVDLQKKNNALEIIGGNLTGSGLSTSNDGQQQFDQGSLSLAFSPEKIDVADLSAALKGEAVKFNGEISPTALANVARKVALHSKSFLGGSFDLGTDYNPSENSVKSKITAGGIPLERAAGAAGMSDSLGVTGTIERLAAESTIGTGEQKNVTALISAQIVNGSILKFNLLADIFKALSQIPALGIQSGDVAGADSAVNAKGTAFDNLKLVTKINGDNVNIESINLTHPLYQLNGSGNINLQGAAKIGCEAIFPASFAEKLTAKNEKFKYALNSDGSLSVPVVIIRSDAGSPWLVLPDVKKLSQKLLKGAGKEAVKEKGSKLLDKVSPGLGSAVKSLF